jgi:hypothetical protein
MSRPSFEDLGNGPNSWRRGPAAPSDEAGPGLLPSLRERVEALVTQALHRLSCIMHHIISSLFSFRKSANCGVYSPATSSLSRPKLRRCSGKLQSPSWFADGDRRENGLNRSTHNRSSCPDNWRNGMKCQKGTAVRRGACRPSWTRIWCPRW